MSEISKQLDSLINSTSLQSNASEAKQMGDYMKNHFEFWGVKKPERADLFVKWKVDWKKWSIPETEEAIKILWSVPQREAQYIAMDILKFHVKNAPESWIGLSENLVMTKSWWDTVDLLASNLVGPLFLKYPEHRQTTAVKWIHSDHMWLRRTAILYQLKYREKTDLKQLEFFILQTAHEKEFFIKKAQGWALRTLGNQQSEWVIQFVEQNKKKLSNLCMREALKHLE
jgi:3-methyladenine DNA glycosylase AlkD